MDQQQARLWLAILLSMVVWLAYDHYILAPARKQSPNQTQVAKETAETMPSPAPPPTTGATEAGKAGAEEPGPLTTPGTEALHEPPSGAPITVDTPLYKAVLTPRGGRLVSFELKRYRTTVDADSPPLQLVDKSAGAILPLSVWAGSTWQDGAVDYTTNQTSFALSAGETASLRLNGHGKDGRSIEKTISFDADTYLLRLDVDMSGGDVPSSMGLVIPKLAETGGYSRTGDSFLAIEDGKLVEHSEKSMKKDEPARADRVDWAGFSGTYFAAVGVPVESKGTAVFGTSGSDPLVRIDTAAKSGVASYLVLMGPKDRDILQRYDHNFDRLIDLGWFWFIASPMLWLLHRIHGVVSNYGIAIIVITILLKGLTFPLNQTSMRSMRKMQEIQPLMQRLRERHKDDPSAMQREMMELYKKHNVNPFSGCLPMVIQIPVFIALYNGLLRDIALRHAPFFGWINDLSAPDRLHVAGFPYGVPVLTLLMGASMLLQQLTAPAQGDPNQRRMMMIMPVVFTFMFIKFPSGLVLYWLVNNVISIGQQYLALRPTT
jgi:YidC/Oxa1 family membrane protein insertase